MFLDLLYLKREVGIVDALVQLGEIALDFQQQTGYRVGIALNIGKGLVVDIQNLV